MKTFTSLTIALTMAVAMLAWFAMPAQAQSKRQGVKPSGTQSTVVIDEKAYNAALKRIPEPKEKYDPWAVARPAEPDKKSK